MSVALFLCIICIQTCFIVNPVVEEEDKKMTGENGEEVVVPMNMSMPNPNGVEFDNLYLDMNGIVNSILRKMFKTYTFLGPPVHTPRGQGTLVYSQVRELRQRYHIICSLLQRLKKQ